MSTRRVARQVVRRAVSAIIAATLVCAPLAPPAAAFSPGRSMVRIRSGVDGRAAIAAVCAAVGCQVLRSLDTVPGDTAPSSLFVVQGIPSVLPPLVDLSALGVESIELDVPAEVSADTTSWGANQATAAVLDQLWNRTPVSYFGSSPWASYFAQPAATIIGIGATQCALSVTGAGATVAIVDTGIDPNHPILAASVTDGYDFTRNVPGGNEMADLDQATAAVLDRVFGVNQATAAVLDQATAAVLDDAAHRDFGHGTMVAGVVHLVAPAALIMPLKAFTSDGSGYTSDIVGAIYYAIWKHAKVINMSFSRSTPSDELQRALNAATSQGLILAGSAGNDGLNTVVYPAGYANVMGVASTTNSDTRSSFSNYGAVVFVAAPGEGVITTFPWGSFAAAWGTSFSTPFVSGAAALLASLRGTVTYDQAATAISQAQPLPPDLGLGHGRLDLYQAVDWARQAWPDAPVADVSAACSSSGPWSPSPTPVPAPSPSPSPSPSPTPAPAPSPSPSP